MKKLLAILMTLTLLCGAALPARAEEAIKDETVYVLAAPNGEARKVIVSDWLSNPEGLDMLEDLSNLTQIENVKGGEAFDGSSWQAAGRDIYYQGVSEQPLPLELTIRYELDGEELSPEEAVGRSGHVRIRFDYAVNQTVSVQLDGARKEVSAPYAVVTGALLENEVFTNVQVVNGRLVNDGDRTLVLGVALPGLQQSLGLDTERVRLPEYVEIEADVENFSLPATMTLASSEVFSGLDAQDLESALEELAQGIAQLVEGSAQLYGGLSELGEGTDQLAEGVTALSDGLNALIENNDSLIAGSTQVFETLLTAANQQLAAVGADVPALTIDNYAETLSGLIGSMDETGIARQARAKVEQGVREQEDQVRAAVTGSVQEEVQAQIEAAVWQGVLEQALSAMEMTAEDYAGALEAGELAEEAQAQIEAAVLQQMQTEEVQALLSRQMEEQMNSEEVQALIDQHTEEQVQALIAQNMESDDVQKQIAQNVARYQESCATLTALRAQLDSYNAFHTGLIEYTGGASAAAEGAAQLKEALPALQQGVEQLTQGALAMKDGLGSLSAEEIEQETGVSLETLMERVRALSRAASASQNYSGIAPETVGRLRFIWVGSAD